MSEQAIQLTLLDDLAEAINAEHRRAQEAMQSSLAHALRCGELLNQAKSQLKHGDWLPWLASNCEFSDRTARAYMRVARNQSELSKSATIANLTFTNALGLLAKPKEELQAESTENPDFPKLDFHKACMIYPWMTDRELDNLAESIKKVGLIYPIVLYEGRILDGKCRYEACRRAGVMPKFCILPDDQDPWDFTWRANAIRAHYNEAQRAIFRHRLLGFQEEGDVA